MDTKICGSNAVCLNSYGSYSCQCNSGFIMDYILKKCIDFDECASSCYNNCTKKNEVCINKPGYYICKCMDGFYKKDNKCNDINECEEGSHKCHIHAFCINLIGSYKCACLKGYYGNGTFCEGISLSIFGFIINKKGKFSYLI